jgi:ribosomal protein S11
VTLGRAMSKQPETKPAQFRLPAWAHEFLAEEAALYGVTKTEIVVRALERLRESEIEALMAEGYRECAEENLKMAEEGMATAAETWPEW